MKSRMDFHNHCSVTLEYATRAEFVKESSKKIVWSGMKTKLMMEVLHEILGWTLHRKADYGFVTLLRAVKKAKCLLPSLVCPFLFVGKPE